MKKILIAGGGTGGHVLPLVTMVRTMEKKSGDFAYMRIGDKEGMEYRYYKKLLAEGVLIDFYHVSTGKLRRERNGRSILKNIRDIGFVLPWSIVRSFFVLARWKPQVVFSKGGHVALPVVLAARLARIPIVLHESDTSPGLVSRITHRFAVHSYTGFEGVLSGSQTVGQLLSDDIAIDHPHEYVPTDDQNLIKTIRATRNQGKTIILVSGGSQGSVYLNRTVQQVLKQYKECFADQLLCVVVGGLRNKQRIQGTIPASLCPTGLIAQETMGLLMAYAHAGIVRGGTTTLQETKLYDLPLCIVPLPVTHDQYGNASYYHTRYQDVIVDQRQAHTQEKIAAYICRIHALYQEGEQEDGCESSIASISENHSLQQLSQQRLHQLDAISLPYTRSTRSPSKLDKHRRIMVTQSKEIIARKLSSLAGSSNMVK